MLSIVANEGSGYEPGELVTLTGGTFSVAVAIRVLATNEGGAIRSYERVQDGAYTALPSNPVASAAEGGTGATWTVTWEET